MADGHLRIAWWQMRGLGQRAVVLVLCVALGVAARVGVGSFGGSFSDALDDQGRGLLTADLEILSQEPLSAEQQAQLADILPDGATSAPVVDVVTMVAREDRARSHIVRLLAAETGWPHAGTLTLTGADGPLTVADLALPEAVCAVQPDLLLHFGIRLGDAIRIGGEPYTVIATIDDLPGLAFGGFAIGSRVMIHHSKLQETGLVEFGSRVRYRDFIALPPQAQIDPVIDQLIAQWELPEDARDGMRNRGGDSDNRIRVRSYRDAQNEVRAVFDRLTGFLRLVALCGLLLAGVGIAAVTRSHIVEQVESIAVLQVLGATGSRVAVMTAMQIAILAFLGSLLGATLGIGAQVATVSIAGTYLPVDLAINIDWGAMAWGLVLGEAMALIAAAGPVLSVVDVRPAAVLRREPPPASRWPRLIGVGVVAVSVLTLLAAYEAGGVVAGAVFVSVLLGATIVTAVVGALVLAVVAALGRGMPGFGLRYGLRALWRQGTKPLPAVVAIGVAATLIGTIMVQRASIVGELDPLRRGGMASLFVINLDRDDREQIESIAAAHAGTVDFAPMVRARLSEIDGEVLTSEEQGGNVEERRRRNFKRREQNLSWRDALRPGEERLMAGEWMDVERIYDLEDIGEASLEVDFARDIGVEIGSVLTFDVQGVPVRAQVTSLRKVDWTSFRPNFFILLSPGLLGGEDGVPADWVAGIELPEESDRHVVQAAVVAAIPQASVFDVALAVSKVRTLIDQALLAVTVLAVFALAAGLVVLAGIVAADARRRREEAALLRVLGANDSTLIGALAVEFAAVGLIAGLLGAGLAVAMAALLQLAWSDLPLAIPWLSCLALGGTVTLLAVGVGLFTCRRVWRAPPLTVLREM